MIKIILKPLSLFGDVPLCNLNESRGIFIGDFCFPLCVRCTAIIVAFLLTVLILLFKKIHFKSKWILFWIIFIIPCIIDGVLQYFFYIESNNLRRLLTGSLCGLGLGNILVLMFNFLNEYVAKK